MIITIRKTDNKLMTWNCGNTDGNPELEEIEILQDELQRVNFLKLYYDPIKKEIYEKNIDIDNDEKIFNFS